MPKNCFNIGESPTNALPVETAEHVTILSDIHRVIEVDEVVAYRRPKGQEHEADQPKANASDPTDLGGRRALSRARWKRFGLSAPVVALRHVSGEIEFAE